MSTAATSGAQATLLDPQKKRRKVSPYWITAALFPAILLVWFVVTQLEVLHPILLPGPEAVLTSIPRVLGSETFGIHASRTLIETLAGFALGAAVGFLLGLLLGSSSVLRAAYLPALSALEAVPTVIIAPLIIAWFGFGIEGKAVQAAIACFYAVFITTLSGLSLANANSVSLMQSLGASKLQTLLKLRVPSALPVIFGGLQLGATTAIIGAIVSEFVGADAGLGFLLLRYRSSYDTPAAWVLILCFLVIGVSAYLLISFAEKRIVFWRSTAVSRPDLEKNDH
ncbi:MAG: ABC transporter permease [Microbacteriaceae bacterium]|nr:ABC transporter permease [Microbacteriaceae bacterium]